MKFVFLPSALELLKIADQLYAIFINEGLFNKIFEIILDIKEKFE